MKMHSPIYWIHNIKQLWNDKDKYEKIKITEGIHLILETITR